MNQQPKRMLLKKSRNNYNNTSRLSADSSSKASDEDNDGWISTRHNHHHTKRRKHQSSSLLVDSSDDDSDDNLLGSISKKATKKPRSKFSKKIIGKKKNSWDDDDSSSSSDDSSAVEVVRTSKKKGKSNNNNNRTMPSKKKQPAAAKINVTNKQSKVTVKCMPKTSKHTTAIEESKTKKKQKKKQKKISRASMNAISTAGNRAVPTSTSDVDRIGKLLRVLNLNVMSHVFVFWLLSYVCLFKYLLSIHVLYSPYPTFSFSCRHNSLPRRRNNTHITPAQSKANRVEIPEDITSINQLQWYRIRLIQSDTRSKECLQPCRILSRGEAAKYRRRRTNNGSIDGNSNSNNSNTVIIQYLNFPNIENGIYKCVNSNLLIPFGYTSKDGLTSSLTFNDDYLHRYIQQQKTKVTKSGLQAEKLFINRIFYHAGDMERKAREMAKCDFREFHGDGSSCSSSSNSSDCESSDGDEISPPKKKKNGAESRNVQFEVLDNTDDDDDDDDNNSNDGDDDDNDEMDELDMPYTQAITFDPDDFDMDEEEERSNEPIRPGDVIEYYSPIYVAGDPRGLRQSTVLAVDPKDDSSPLVLDNGEGLPTNTKVKRIKVKSGDDLLEHPGIFRPIYKFRLVKGGTATAADAIAHETARFGKIMKKNISKLKEKAEADGFAPMDMIVNIKGTKNTTNPSPPRTKYSSTSASRKKRKEQDAQSSEDDDNSSEEDESTYSKSKQKVPSQRKKAPETKSRTTETTNKENNGTESTSSPDKDGSQETKLSLGSLSSTSASLGSSLATSEDDDSSIESVPVNLGKNHKKMTQYETSSNLKDKLVTKPTAAKSSSKRRLKLDFNPALQSTQQSSSSLLLNDNKKGSIEKASRQKKLPSSPLLSSSDDDSSSSSSISSSRRPVKKQTKSAKLSSSSAKKRRPASSSDSVEIVSGNKSKGTAKKRPSPPSDLSSSDDSDDDDDVARAKPRKLHNRRVSDKPIRRNCKAKNDGVARLPTSSNSKSANTLGWTRGKAGWKKTGDDKSPGFSFMKAN